jgi:hypothetical protein
MPTAQSTCANSARYGTAVAHAAQLASRNAGTVTRWQARARSPACAAVRATLCELSLTCCRLGCCCGFQTRSWTAHYGSVFAPAAAEFDSVSTSAVFCEANHALMCTLHSRGSRLRHNLLRIWCHAARPAGTVSAVEPESRQQQRQAQATGQHVQQCDNGRQWDSARGGSLYAMLITDVLIIHSADASSVAAAARANCGAPMLRAFKTCPAV